jgi:hypothetical protein
LTVAVALLLSVTVMTTVAAVAGLVGVPPIKPVALMVSPVLVSAVLAA